MVLTEKLSRLEPFSRSLSSIQGLIFFLWIKDKNLSTFSISQSLKGLRKVGDQPPCSLTQFHTSATIASFCTAKKNIERNKEHNASSPHQTSFQKLTLLPSPQEKAAFWRKRSYSFLISFHNPTPKPHKCANPQKSPHIFYLLPFSKGHSSHLQTSSSICIQELCLAWRSFSYLNPLFSSLYKQWSN